MRVWVQRGGGRAYSAEIPTAEKLWTALDWWGNRWLSRTKRRPKVAIHVVSDTGESLLQYVRPAFCRRHTWHESRGDCNRDVCRACGKTRTASPQERMRRSIRNKHMEDCARAAFADFCRIVAAHGKR